VHRTGRVIGQVDVRAEPVLGVDVGGVHAARDALGEIGDDLRMERVVERADDDAILAVGRVLAGEDEHLALLVRHDVVDVPGRSSSGNRRSADWPGR
jgi:hypothetical protein